MGKILITGASGTIGSQLARTMLSTHDILCLSRRRPDAPAPFVQGAFHSPDDLRRLDDEEIDAVIHLAAVTGGCSEDDGMQVNVEGTRQLLRYLTDKGCRRFVLASSFAVVGIASKDFRPLQLPIPDAHPCLARDAYGFTKYLMEETARYYARRYTDMDVVSFRIGAVAADDATLTPRPAGEHGDWALASVSLIRAADVVRLLRKAVDSPPKPGVRVLNATARQALVLESVPEVARKWYPDVADGLDLSFYDRPGHERDSFFDIRGAKAEFGFDPE